MAKDDENKKIRKDSAMPVEDLPEVLIADILSRLQVKSLLRFRSVCKLWCALITDPTFIKMHLNRSLASNSNLSLVSVGLYCCSLNLDAVEQQSPLALDHPLKLPHDQTRSMGSCNGLLCIYNYDDDMYLWNPSTKRHHKLPMTPKEFPNQWCICRPSVYGFGYDPIADDYKLVRIVQFHCDDDHYFYPEVKLYSLSTNSWRRIRDMPFQPTHIHRFGVLANHVLHWVAKCNTRDTTSTFILSFDLQDEEFCEVPLPDFVDNKVQVNFGEDREVPHSHFVENKVYMNLGVLGGQLCMICNFLWDRVEVWVMKEYGLKGSWVKLFSIEQPLVVKSHVYLRPICYSKKGEVIVEMDSRQLILYDTARGRARKLLIHGASSLERSQASAFYLGRFETEICIGSLVLLKDEDGTNSNKPKGREIRRGSMALCLFGSSALCPLCSSYRAISLGSSPLSLSFSLPTYPPHI